MLAQVSSNGGAGWIFNGDYFGLSQMSESGAVLPRTSRLRVAPCAGTLKNFRTWTVAAAPVIQFHRLPGRDEQRADHNATSAVIAIASGAHLARIPAHIDDCRR